MRLEIRLRKIESVNTSKETEGYVIIVVGLWPVCVYLQGVLDLLANRCLASGTNAWTDTDHTCYTMTTAGNVGFLNLLPVYLDHILYPLLTVRLTMMIIILILL